MSWSGGPTAGVRGRLVSGAAHVTDMGGTRGRTLFPSPEFSHWPPFETLVEVSTMGSNEPDPHPHAAVEVVNYVIRGTLLVFDEERRAAEIPTGSVSLLSTVRPQMHDVTPKPGTTAHWLSLILHLPRGTAEPERPYQNAAAERVEGTPVGVESWSIVGPPGPVRSRLGLEMRLWRFSESRSVERSVGAGRTAAVYVLEGNARAADRSLPAGSGLLADDVESLTIEGAPGSQVVSASVRRDT